jgi:ribokinase
MYDVITVGSSTVDVFAKVESELIKIKTVHHEEELIAYPCGTKILVKELKFLTGGGGTNTAVALSKLGLNVAYLGKIGSGGNSNLIVRRLRKENIDFIGVHSEKHHAGYSVILDSLEGDRTILAYKGANNFLKFGEINLNKLKTKWFYFSSMVEGSYETLEKLADYAVKHNIQIAFNPSNYLAEKGRLFLKEVLMRTNLLVLNKEEAGLIAGNHKIDVLLKELLELGPQYVVITDGKRGAYTVHGKNILHVLPNNIKIIETTGAGDGFASTFLSGLVKEKSIETCLRMALINAESVIQIQGAKNGLLSYRKLNELIKKDPPKIKKLTF